MYYSFYLNEEMLLDNWRYYGECNMLLKNCLSKDSRKSHIEMASLYFNLRNEKKQYKWNTYITTDVQTGKKIARYTEKPNGLHVEDYEHYFLRRAIKNLRMNMKLRKVNEVVLYKSDFDAIEQARKEHHLTQMEIEIMFGLIFFSRMHDVRWCRIGTNFKRQQFMGCFNTWDKDAMYNVLHTGFFKDVDYNKDPEGDFPWWWKEKFYIKDENDYIYTNFDNKDEVAYVFKTTLENNKLNLSQVAADAIPDIKDKYCIRCGEKFNPASNRQKYCDKCKKEVNKEQAAERKRKQRAKAKSGHLEENHENMV